MILCFDHPNICLNPTQNTTSSVDTVSLYINAQQCFQHTLDQELEEFHCSKRILGYTTFSFNWIADHCINTMHIDVCANKQLCKRIVDITSVDCEPNTWWTSHEHHTPNLT